MFFKKNKIEGANFVTRIICTFYLNEIFFSWLDPASTNIFYKLHYLAVFIPFENE